MRFSLNTDTLFKWHVVAIGLLGLGNAFTIACFELFGLDHMKGIIPLLELDGEQNLPAYFSAIALLLVAGGCFLSARTFKAETTFWNVLSATFVFLSVDEAVSIHEILTVLAWAYVDPNLDFASPWLIPYSVLLLFFLLFISRNLLRIPARTRNGLIVAGSVFIVGAIGFEIIGAFVFFRDNITWMTKSLAYSLIAFCEETLEMLGIAMALRVILRHLSGDTRVLHVDFAAGTADSMNTYYPSARYSSKSPG